MNIFNTEEAFVLSSLKEFVKVWGSGRKANLNLECRNGLACIKLSFNLANPASVHQWSPQPLHQVNTKKHSGPSRKRKNVERAKAHHARLSAATAGEAGTSPTSQSASSTAASAVETSTGTEPQAPASPPSTPPLPTTASGAPPDPTPVKSTAAASGASQAISPVVVATAPSPTAAVPASVASLPTPSVIVPVYCLAVFENCPDEVLSQEYGTSLEKYLASEQHLCQNIASA